MLVTRIALCVLLLCPTLLRADAPYSRIVVFGDSVSDNGNMFALTGGLLLPPPYFGGRATNGFVWAEQLADEWDAELLDYAFIGALTADGLGPVPSSLVAAGAPEDLPIPGMGLQVDAYLAANEPNDETLYVLFGGSNDIFFGGADNKQSVKNLRKLVRRLYKQGARHFLVANVPPLGETPFATLIDPASQPALEFLSADFNTLLDKRLDQLDHLPGIVIHRLDMEALLLDVIANPGSFGLVNATFPAILLLGDPEVDVDDFLFWDDVHPTRVGHAIIAAEAKWIVETSPALAP